MKRKILLGLTVLVLQFNQNIFAGDPDQPVKKSLHYFQLPAHCNPSDYLPNTIVLRMKPAYRNYCSNNSIDVSAINNLFSQWQVNSVEKIFPNHQPPAETYNRYGNKLVDLSLIYKIHFTGNTDLVQAINELYALGVAEYVEPFYIPTIDFTPNEPAGNLSQEYHLTKIQAYNAWDISKGDTNVVIGIVDNGTDWDHPDLVNNIKYNYADPINGADDDGDGYVDNYRGYDLGAGDNNPMVDGTGGLAHGSHTSGCAAASTNNGTGVASPGYKCKFLPVKISDISGTLTKGYEGIVYAADHGCSVINCSWGGAAGGSLQQNSVDYATFNKNALVVAAAGNNAVDEDFYPASLDNVLSVASTNSSDSKSGFSNYSVNVDVCAPGSNIYSTFYDNGYSLQSGTSMASPVAAGCAGVIKSFYPSFSAEQVGEQLRVTCDDIYSVSGNSSYPNRLGKGRINLYRALTETPPSIRATDFEITDGNDNTIVVNDTMRIVPTFKNFLSPTSNLTVTLSSTSTYITVQSGLFNAGILATLDTVSNFNSAFLVKVKSNAPVNAVVALKLTYTDGTYTDFQIFSVTINVDYIDVAVNDVATTITSKGRIGYNGEAQVQGLGFTYMGGATLLYEGGLMIGNSSSKVQDNVRGATATDNDFVSATRVQKLIPALYSDFDLAGKFNDNASATSPIPVEVRHYANAFTLSNNRKFVIVQYTIKNKGTTTLNNIYAGIFCDWDIMDYAHNRAATDVAHQMGYAYSTDAGGLYAGVKLLSPSPFIHYAVDNINGGSGGVNMYDGYDEAEKYTTLSANRAAAGAAGQGNDVIDVVSTGPFTIAAGDSVWASFALIAGDDLIDLQKSADHAVTAYHSMPLAVNETDHVYANTGLMVFPNPASDNLTVQFYLPQSGAADLKIVNTLGEEVFSSGNKKFNSGMNSVKIDTGKLLSGIYFVQLISKSGIATSKIVIE